MHTPGSVVYSAKLRISIARYKAKHIHKRQTHLLVREMLLKDYYRKSSVEKILAVSLEGFGAKTN
jgi:hypothetical protein